ncbi:MAG: purine-binding chemotaxis protein CheW [Crocinitomicaceae bacterium]|nr:purine-binding chemotaxis protein CheW [Crocinitomicaceae bacterium]
MALAEQISKEGIEAGLEAQTLNDNENLEQYLTFMLAEEEYGVDILSVKEIRGWESVTPVPNSPKHIKGVINLRGTIVPIVDLRAKFNLVNVAYGPLTVVIVLGVMLGDEARVMGVVVDAVSDVYGVSLEKMQPAPDLDDNVDTKYIQGLAAVAEKMIVILDIDALLAGDMREHTVPGLVQ